MKKLLTLVLLLFFVGSASAGVNNIVLDLVTDSYGPSQEFDGTISIETDEGDLFSVNEEIRTDFRSCDGNDPPERYHSLYDVLVNAELFSGTEYIYEKSDSVSSITYDASSETDIFGFFTENSVSSVDFTVTGDGSSVFIDVGVDDEYDWSYFGERSGWSDFIYSEGFEGETYSGQSTVDYNVRVGSACNTFNLEFNQYMTDLELDIFATARKIGDETLLKAVVDNGDLCDLSVTSSSYSEVSCTVSIDVSGDEGQREIEVCLKPYVFSEDSFEIPKLSGEEYFFIRLKQGVYETGLSGEEINVDGTSLKNILNSYRSDFCIGSCLIPFRIILESGSVVLSNLNLQYGGSTDSNFWNVVQDDNEVELNDVVIPLSAFEGLLTPDEGIDSCLLEVEFRNEEDLREFSVGSAPEAVITIDSLYFVEDVSVKFDASYSNAANGSTISNYLWDFGDGTNSSLKSPSHTYAETGDYEVNLIVYDNNGISDSEGIIIHVVELESYLGSRFSEVEEALQDAQVFFSNPQNEILKLYNLLDFGIVLSSSDLTFESLKSNFTSVKVDSSLGEDAKNVLYGDIATSLEELSKSVPERVNNLESLFIVNFVIDTPDSILPYSGSSDLEYSEFLAYKNNLYNFNQENVDVDAYFDLLEVNYISGTKNYLVVRKEVSVTGGSNNVIVENLKDYDLDKFYGDGIIDSSFGVVYWDVFGSKNIDYVLEVDVLDLIETVVFSDVDYDVGDVIYDFNCPSGECDYRYCGDGLCSIIPSIGLNEGEESDQYYCEIDCKGKEPPLVEFLILAGILLLGIAYINFYKGPGNFQSIANKIVYKLFKRKLFVTDKDRVVLMRYIHDALKRGFNEDHIRIALARKGWNMKQLDAIFKDLKHK